MNNMSPLMLPYTLRLTPETLDALLRMANRLGCTPGEVLAKGLTLLDVAIDAEAQGKAIGVAAPDNLEVQVVNL